MHFSVKPNSKLYYSYYTCYPLIYSSLGIKVLSSETLYLLNNGSSGIIMKLNSRGGRIRKFVNQIAQISINNSADARPIRQNAVPGGSFKIFYATGWPYCPFLHLLSIHFLFRSQQEKKLRNSSIDPEKIKLDACSRIYLV